MKSIVCQSIGIDIAKKDFKACCCSKLSDNSLKTSSVKSFDNNPDGFKNLIKWAKEKADEEISKMKFVMEPTGIYHERLAMELSKTGCSVYIASPTKTKYYIKCIDIRSKTDEIDAKAIARMGIEMDVQKWIQPLNYYLKLKNITRYIAALTQEICAFKNRCEPLKLTAFVDEKTTEINNQIIDFIDSKIKQCEDEIEKLISENQILKEEVKRLETIPGVARRTACVVLAETNGFTNFKNYKQLVSYCGMDVVKRESGTSVKAKTKISKHGTSFVRRVLYMSAMHGATKISPMAKMYDRLAISRPNKKIGLVAVMRRMLVLCYTLHKNKTVFDEKFRVPKKVKLQGDETKKNTEETEIVA